MLLHEPRNLDKEVNLGRIVSNFNAVDTTGKVTTFTQDGVFSTRIFGNMGTSVSSWSCDCGELQGEFNEGVICNAKNCGTPVGYKGLSIEREGWIKLNHAQIHPLFIRYLNRIIGKTAFQKIIKYKSEINGNGIPIEPEMVAPYHGIGIQLFQDHFQEVIDYYFDKKKNTAAEYNFIMEHREKVFCNYFPILNSRLRPAIVVDGEFSFDEINIFYNALIRNCNMLEELSSMEQIPNNTQAIAYKTQLLLSEVYDTDVKLISSKEGAIRDGLLGNRLNFTSRMVITPLGSDAKLDEVDIPYISALELFKPSILQRLSVLKNCTLTKALEIWSKAIRKFDKVVYSIVTELAKLPNIRMLCNRNPTIGIGSIVLLKIRKVKKDVKDLTASIHNLILKTLGGDYDGGKFLFFIYLAH